MNDPHIEPPVSIFRNPITIAGAILTTVSALLFVAFVVLDMLGVQTNHYLGIVFVVAIPGLFILGLLVMPLGIWRERRRLQKGLAPSLKWWPRIDLNSRRVRIIAFAIVVLTPVNVLIVSVAGYKAVEVSDSVVFCGATCHTVMQPEYTAYQNGPHARVKCVDCHIGEGAGWFVKAKISGARQVLAVMRSTYSRPIDSPVHNLRPAGDTCENCHWPAKFHGDKLETIHDYADDEANTESVTSLRLRIGGRDGGGRAGGIHWHVAAENAIEYVALDNDRQNIGWVRQSTPEGGVVEYRAEGVTDADLAGGRAPAHGLHRLPQSPEPCLRPVRGAGRQFRPCHAAGLPRTCPSSSARRWRRSRWTTRSQEEASVAIDRALTEFYKKQYPDTWTKRQADITRTVASMQDLYKRNIFPSMKVTWGFHPDNRGHMEFPGCFRCHDDAHKSKDGKVIRQDCELCHEVS